MRYFQRKKVLRLLLVLVLLVTFTGGLTLSGFAAEGQETTSRLKKIWMEVWGIINFLILAFFLVKLLRQPLTSFFQGRARLIRDQMQTAEQACLEAEHELQGVESQLERLDGEIQKLQQAISEQGEKEREKIIANAQKNADQVLDRARLEADFMLQQAKSQLRAEVAKTAVRLAEETLRAAIDVADQKRLVDDYLQNLTEMTGSST